MKQKINNFFLTGKIHIGKTTVLNKVLKDPFFHKLKIKGFRTSPIIENGVVKGYMLEIINGEKKYFAHTNLASSEKFDRFKVNPIVFNDLALENVVFQADIILMDEIGVIEKRARGFKDFILQCLNSEKMVLGVFQRRALWFVELIKNRTDTIIFEISENNRDAIHKEIIKKIYCNIKILLTNLK